VLKPLSIIALALMLGALQWRLWIAEGGLAHTHQLRQRAAAERLANEALRQRNAARDAEVQDLNSGQAAIEARARMMLGMIKPDETFYLVVDAR
jgi:cell division protein FtsB